MFLAEAQRSRSKALERALIYGVYGAAGAIALAVYYMLPKGGRDARPLPAVVLAAFALGVIALLLGRLLGGAADRLYVILLSLLTIFGAMKVVTHPRPVYSAIYFGVVVLATAGLVVLAGAEFLAAALIIVYAGAILVTYVFVIMMAQQSSVGAGGGLGGAADYDRRAREPVSAVLVGFMLMATVGGVLAGHQWPAAADGVELSAEGNTLAIGRLLLGETGFAVGVQLAGVLLMVAMVGAIALARRKLPPTDEPKGAMAPGEIGRRVGPF